MKLVPRVVRLNYIKFISDKKLLRQYPISNKLQDIIYYFEHTFEIRVKVVISGKLIDIYAPICLRHLNFIGI